ncbi:hypothetical protein [Paracoccus sanguinis]|uniref:Molybdopterin-dependent oxidoreductase n=1 Tax=Paracoccus sanguinis TaxID=1545044 RepID=A0A1H2WN85_9RHOB|nr:hypothetical protein [Paracoccus sanguinis]SDW82092.1 hypothetical protein SAMN05444276_102214 [Paracoccus sanguinis]
MSRLSVVCALALFALSATPGLAEPSQPTLAAGAQAHTTLSAAITADTLAGLPVEEVDVRYETSKGPRAEHYNGPRLWAVLGQLGLAPADPKPALRQSVIVTGRDGHAVAFSMGELMPDFGNRAVLLSLTVDGLPTQDGVRAVSPGDGRGARYVKDVVSVEIR